MRGRLYGKDIDEAAAERYLKVVRYLDSCTPERMMDYKYNSTSTIQSLVRRCRLTLSNPSC
jgi:hypothetical protein